MAWRIIKGDKVVVVSGSDKGKAGEVIRVDRKLRRVVVEGVNVVTRHQKPRPGQAEGIVRKEMSVDVSNVMMMDPQSQRPTRVGFKFLEDGRKVRFAKNSGAIID